MREQAVSLLRSLLLERTRVSRRWRLRDEEERRGERGDESNGDRGKGEKERGEERRRGNRRREREEYTERGRRGKDSKE